MTIIVGDLDSNTINSSLVSDGKQMPNVMYSHKSVNEDYKLRQIGRLLAVMSIEAITDERYGILVDRFIRNDRYCRFAYEEYTGDYLERYSKMTKPELEKEKIQVLRKEGLVGVNL